MWKSVLKKIKIGLILTYLAKYDFFILAEV